MIVCDVFDFHAAVEGSVLRWAISTDLPGGTRLIVDVSRIYIDTRENECRWSLWNNAVLLMPIGPSDRNGVIGNLNIDEGDAHGLQQFNDGLGQYSSGILNPLGPEVRVQFTVGARQPMKAFGKNTCNLTGDMVEESGGINIVRAEMVVIAEMAPEFQPVDNEA